MNAKKSVNEGTRIGVLNAHAREKDDKKISRGGADANEGMSTEQGRKGKGWARGKDQSWTLCEHRGGEEAEDVLSRIIPKFGGSGIPNAAAAVSTSALQPHPLHCSVVGGVADKKGTCPSPGVCARTLLLMSHPNRGFLAPK